MFKPYEWGSIYVHADGLQLSIVCEARDNQKMMVYAKGVVKLSIGDIKYTLIDVFYVPDLTNNLISVG